MNNFWPYGNRILVERLPDEDKTNGGIVLPDSAKKKNRLGRVISIGDKHEVLKPGDYILLVPYTGVEIDDTYLCLKEEDIVAYIPQEDMKDCTACD